MNIVVLGGGTAGWLTALLAKEFYQHHDVTVVESEEIGILGAGEGTVPHFISVLDTIGIPVSDLVKNCKATVKTGIRFENWNGDDHSYFHPFHGRPGVSLSSCDVGDHFLNIIQTKEIAAGKQLTSIAEELTNYAKVPFSYANRIENQSKNPILRLENHANFALHFDARELAGYLRRVANGRGIKRINGKLEEIVSNTNGEISHLVLDNKIVVPVDFIFDCSGFSRLLIGEHFNSQWNSYSQHLPMKAAVPFVIPHDNENIRPETNSIAMKYGWMWQIPVQGRYGCGYVYDSDYITGEQALAEAEEYFGMKLESPKSFEFDAGTFNDTYVKNCMAVGLAQSFVEPLESTSILISCMNLLQFLKYNGVIAKGHAFRKFFNAECRKRNQEVLEFVYLHYLTKRDDSEFWRNFRKCTIMPVGLSEKLELWNDVAPGEYVDSNSVFSLSSWLHISDGLGLLNPVTFAHKMIELSIDSRIGTRYIDYVSNLDSVVKASMNHQEFINFLNSN
jgi:tryptophan halogenase